jgi:hypothetical protein
MSEPIRLQINISMYQPGSGGTIRVEENVDFPAGMEFLELAKVLSQFHELAQQIKNNREQQA